MRKNAFVLAVALCAAMLFSGCQKTTETSGTVSGASSSVKTSSSEAKTASKSSGTAQPGTTASSQGGSVQQGGMVKNPATDSNDFNNKFKANPIDKAYIPELKAAVSNVDMVKVSNKYANIWEKEVDHAYSELKTALMTSSTQKWKTIETEQKKWTDGKAASLKKIVDGAAAAGGSMAQVEAASKTTEFYRNRAVQLYRQLYDTNKNYTYAYTGK